MKKIHIGFRDKSDEVLMMLITEKDKSAFEELYKRYSKKMLCYFYRMLWNDYNLAKDFLQDLFLKIIEKPEMFDSQKIFSVWFYSLASNMCKNEYKRTETRNEHILNQGFNYLQRDENYSDVIDLKLFKEELYLHLKSLSYEHKTIFLLRYGNDLSIKEIAEILQCPVGTVKSRLFYTIKYLSERLNVYNPKVS
jgi:RNA polymerase sigma-70 factor, ECF subfamily